MEEMRKWGNEEMELLSFPHFLISSFPWHEVAPMQFLKHNWPWKLLSLGLATVIAIYVQKQEDIIRRTLLMPVTIPTPAGQREVEHPRGVQVRVDLEGPAELVSAIDTDDVKIPDLDIANVRPGVRTRVPIAVELAPKYGDRVLLDWRPRAVMVKLVSDMTAPFPVTVKMLNRPEGWKLKEVPRASPPRVNVSGPEAVVKRVVSVVAPFVAEETQSISVPATLQALDAGGAALNDQSLRFEPTQVLVTALLERVALQKRVPVQPVFHAPPGMHVSVEVVPAQVRVIGPERAVSDIYVVETDLLEIPPGQTQISRQVSLSTPREGVEVTPSRVRVTLKLLPISPSPPPGDGNRPGQ
jgi:YbbR domain-containing protein